MKVTYKKRNIFFPVCFIIAVILCAVCFGAWNSGAGNVASNVVNVTVSPLQYCANGISDTIEDATSYFSNHKKLVEENKTLKAENAKLHSVEAQNKQLMRENEDLYGYLELKKERIDFKLANARIIARTGSNYSSAFVIDKGTFHGIKANMPIINSNGALLGVVLSADKTSSKCLSLTSYDINVGVYNERTGITGMLNGSYELFADGKCSVSNLPSQTDIKAGDRIFTSGMGDIYPGGLIIGTVESTHLDAQSHTKSAVVKPEASQFNEDNIMVITSFERTFEK